MFEVKQTSNTLTEPSLCTDCGGRNFRMLEDECDFIDMQIITLQEPHEQLTGKSQPRPLRIYAEQDIVDTVAPGELIRVTGVLNSAIRDRNKHREMHINAIHMETLAKEFEEIKITPEDKQEILALSQHPDLYNKIIRSVAPLIEGHERFKEAVMLQLFGGSSVDIDNADVHLRSNVHILIVGDPGIGKSQILKYISKLAPGGIYASGKGTTGVGLTAAFVSDEVGGWTLEAGALVLGDQGFVCIDEMDKMRAEDRSSMHEALEQETITINKAGINATLNARCSVLGAANPKYGRFNRYKTIAQQLDLPPTLLSRFDLIFVVEDHPDEARDKRIARHIANLRSKQNIKFEIEPLLLKKYIAYARQNFNPVLPDENVELIEEYYVRMRMMNGNEDDAPLAITPRQLEGLIRLAGASAKIHLRNEITVGDIKKVIDLK